MGSLAEFDSSVYRELTGGWESNVVGYLDFSGTPWYYIGVPGCDFLIL